MATPRSACAHAYLLPLLLVLLPCCGHLRRAAAQSSQPVDEAQLLLRIKRAWGDPPLLAAWTNATGAGAGAHCAWPYVRCDAARRVANLTLGSINVTGPFPDAVGDLSGLTYLDVSNNNIKDAFPTALYRLGSLQFLNLSQNYFEGQLPADVGTGLAANLTTLDINGNNFNGTIPASLSGLRNLRHLALDRNFFAGGFPSFVWSLKKLERLSLWSNELTGGVVVDDDLAALSLQTIDISKNNLSGPIPQAFGRLENLTWLSLFSNNFSGEIPASIGGLPSLWVLRISNNNLNGTLPPELGKHSLALSFIEANDNDLTGAIPEGLCDGRQLQSLTVSNNRLDGSIPAGLANCATLRWLALDSNQLTGQVPEALFTATQLGTLLLGNNRLTGTLPSTLYSNLARLDLENNQIGGSIPAEAAALKVFAAGSNRFSGDIPASLGDGMPQLQKLDLSGNRLTGEIPRSLGKLSQLTQMDMSENQLTGGIPAELGGMPVLSLLDLSSNRLSGDIPPALANPSLTSLNLSSNQLSGEVPAALAVGANDRSFLDNPGLCTTAARGQPGGYLAGVRSCSGGSPASSGGVTHALRTGLLAAGASLLVVAAAFAFFVVRDVRKRRRLAKQGDWKVTPFQVLDFSDAAILRGLTEENLIGRGGSGRVYRVAYTNRRNGSAGVVAVKRIRTGGEVVDEKLEHEFEAEARVLGGVRHNNIVRLLCCLSGAEAKLLVYEHMGNGSLDRWLHGEVPLGAGAGHGVSRVRSVRRAQLDWPTRIRVAVGVAQGLCYMHHECAPPIVHRDVKTSNILLDSEFRAKVADFGLARVLLRAGAPETMSAVAGSFGYMAPECAYSKKVNEKVDVYSFGVVLLELTTGKEANDGGEHGCLADWARQHYQSGGSIPDATDKGIRYAGYADEIEVVLRLGVLCTSSAPSSRPTMKDVLQILLKCSEQTHQKSKAEHSATPEYEAAPFLAPQRGSRRKQLSNTTGMDTEEKSDFDSIV